MQQWFLRSFLFILSFVCFPFVMDAREASIELGMGYRLDRLQWITEGQIDVNPNIPDDRGMIDVDSSLKWRNLHIWQIEGNCSYVTRRHYYFRVNGDYGWITSGINSDKDELKNVDETSLEFAFSKSRSRGNVYDARIAVGYQFKFFREVFAFSPIVGFSWHGQNLLDSHLKQRGKLGNEFSFKGIHSRYHTHWDGIFLGCDFDYSFKCFSRIKSHIFGSYEFHFANYHAKGDWVLRQDLIGPFHHHVNRAYGQVFDVGFKWDFCERWTISFKGEFQWWWADRGQDKSKVYQETNGYHSKECFLKLPLKDVEWNSAAISCLIGIVF